MGFPKDDMLKASILIAAHPDDEILWFSSIMDKVNELLFCYTDCESHPHWGIGRRNVLSDFPLKKVSSLELTESGIFDKADWNNPKITEFGIEIAGDNRSGNIYRQNYSELKQVLREKLQPYRNVITHNPWGEYGHEEHVQIYRVLSQLQHEMHYNLWFSNYCSNKSFPLASEYISGFTSQYVTMQTNKALANNLLSLYKKNQCWTWLDNWEWFNEESFMKSTDLTLSKESFGHIFPLNMIRLNYRSKTSRSGDFRSILLQLRRLARNALKDVSLKRVP